MIDITKIEIRPSALYAFAKTLPLIFFSIASLFLAYYFSPLLSLLAIVLAGMGLYRYAYIRMILYTITSERLIIRTGIIFKQIDQLEFYRVKDYITTQPLLMQIFKIMNVHLVTTDTANKKIILTGIPLSNIVETIRTFVQEARIHNRIFEVN